MSISGADSDDVVGGGAELADSIMAVLGRSPRIDGQTVKNGISSLKMFKLGGLAMIIFDSVIFLLSNSYFLDCILIMKFCSGPAISALDKQVLLTRHSQVIVVFIFSSFDSAWNAVSCYFTVNVCIGPSILRGNESTFPYFNFQIDQCEIEFEVSMSVRHRSLKVSCWSDTVLLKNQYSLDPGFEDGPQYSFSCKFRILIRSFHGKSGRGPVSDLALETFNILLCWLSWTPS